MISNFYNKLKETLIGIDLKEAKDFFDLENVPDSLMSNSFIIGPAKMTAGDKMGSNNRIQIFNLAGELTIYYSRKIPGNMINQEIIAGMEKVEDIIKAVLGIETGADAFDDIDFDESSTIQENGYFIAEINFTVNFRLTNLS